MGIRNAGLAVVLSFSIEPKDDRHIKKKKAILSRDGFFPGVSRDKLYLPLPLFFRPAGREEISCFR